MGPGSFRTSDGDQGGLNRGPCLGAGGGVGWGGVGWGGVGWMKGQVAEGFKGRASSASARFGGGRLQSGPLVRTIRSVVWTIRRVVRTIRPVAIRPWEGSALMGGCRCHLFNTLCLPLNYLSFTFFSPTILPFFTFFT